MNAQPQEADSIVEARWVVPVDPAHSVLTGHAIVITSGRIVAILPAAEARGQFRARQHIVLDQHTLIPGLINLHTHSAMTLMRGLADDIALMDWLKNHIWPAEMRHVSDAFVHDGTRLACAEMLRGGVTCFNDMYFFPRASARAAREAGMRAVLGLIVLDLRSQYASDAEDYLNKGLAMRDELRDEPLLSFALAPHAPYTVGDKSLRQIATFADELDLPVHMHVHETRDEIAQSVMAHGMRPLARLGELGLLGPGFIAVHAVHLERGEMDVLAQQGCHVAHCPTSNLKLASGLAPVGALLAAGINIGLGSDGAASNNRLDMFAEMRLTALLAKGASGDATTLPAWKALEMATLNAARALGMDDTIGSLAPGKYADIAAVKMDDLELAPCYDPLSHLIYSAGREHVSHVWVGGNLVVNDGNLLTLDTRDVQARAVYWRDRIGSS
jgi:5-methylthioadenosine/S-adenosylhomocysteine deaminase